MIPWQLNWFTWLTLFSKRFHHCVCDLLKQSFIGMHSQSMPINLLGVSGKLFFIFKKWQNSQVFFPLQLDQEIQRWVKTCMSSISVLLAKILRYDAVHFHNRKYRLLPGMPYFSVMFSFFPISNGTTLPQNCIPSRLPFRASSIAPWSLQNHYLIVLGVRNI